MPRLRIEDDELDVDELENAEWDESKKFDKYEGEIPPKDTVLVGYLKNAWWTETQAGDRMIKVLWIADGNTGDEEEYNGCPFWENLALTASSKFKWAPFFRQFGLTVKMVKTQTMIAEDDDNVGAPITRIGKHFIPGEDTRCGIITGREKYNGQWQARVAEWMDEDEALEDEEELDEDEEEMEEEEAEFDEQAEIEEDEEDDEEEEDAPPPPRRAAAKKPAAASTKKPSARPAAAARPSRPSPPAKPSKPTAKAAATKAAPARTTSKASTKPAARTRRAKAADNGYDDEPPF